MRIAVNSAIPGSSFLNENAEYARQLFAGLVLQHPEHEFVFIFRHPEHVMPIQAPNVTSLVVPLRKEHPLALKYWYDVKIPLALKAFRPDVWIQADGNCSLKSRIPQVLFADGQQTVPLSWLKKSYRRWFLPLFMRKAATIIVPAESIKDQLVQQYKIADAGFSVIHAAPSPGCVVLNWQEKETIKEQYASGMEYFFCPGGSLPQNNLLNILKGFSFFKKWQHSSMKLLIAGDLHQAPHDLPEKLKSYKYREDVVLLSQLSGEELSAVMAGAYAFVDAGLPDTNGINMLNAMMSEVPVIGRDHASAREIGAEAVLYADPANAEIIGKHMLALYKDEVLRSRFVRAGKELAETHTWQSAADQLAVILTRVVSGQK
ncbi:glycosyltransferase [Sediminibacterium ginsengisoli]|uniref:Glycosyltransferase involved in cell wall bisynthesis n=1 Tax=Sediminibacterium ginsengisoli TaxID=413434 RepID=A0A1T4M533_9BACT|nr:glycosyltransferase [Sediminibacterium ginsengisoli]SJZ62032.1 Glycosyltransferase involved in cell wall bisynthesis [Sediminibacterium ginsengisoli]